MSFDGRPEGRKKSIDEKKRELITERRGLINWLLETPRTLENRIVREETWTAVKNIERQLDALNAIA